MRPCISILLLLTVAAPLSGEDRSHWAFQPIWDGPPPPVEDTQWLQSPIDRFVLARLEGAGLAPSPPADRRTLIRRAFYDLIGLPPTWRDLRAFVEDPRPTPEAFAEVVETLLQSPRYGERWGRHWLDVARFADTKDGVLMYGDDRIRPYAYTYRDYVIRAFNEDVPFDRFVHEQLAADLIRPELEPWRLAAMGFLTLGRMYDNNIHDVIDDQIDTTTRGLLGLTVACARCHDHKYDPIPTADYYSLYGVFAGSEAPLELPLIGQPKGPEGAEFEREAAAKRAELHKFLGDQFALLSEATRGRVMDYLVHVATTEPDPLETEVYFLSLAPDDLRPPIVARWRTFLERRARPEDPVFGPWYDLMKLFDSGVAAKDVDARRALLLAEWAGRPGGTRQGQLNPLVREALSSASLVSRKDVARAYGELLKRIYEESKTDKTISRDAARQQLLEIVAGHDSPAWFPKSQTRIYMSRADKDAIGGKLQDLDRMAVRSPHAPPRAMVLVDCEVQREPRILIRGNPSRPGDHVPRQFLDVLTEGERTPFGTGSGRLELARAITSPTNPLTARVIVNRVWMHHFGEPLVATPSDFGTRGTPPTHPKLLDHLATWFMQHGWSLKKLHRYIMRSAAYHQGTTPAPSHPSPRNPHAVDPDNHLLWRMNRRRLDFEAMRDTLLALSGRLEHRSGGRPVDIANDPESRCRTVYGLVDRQSLPSVFRAFDFANPDQSVACRVQTTVPQQALFAMNSEFVVLQAKGLAARSEVAAADDHSAKIAALFRIALLRNPSPDELADSLAFVRQEKDEASELSKWEQLSQVLLSSNELMYLD